MNDRAVPYMPREVLESPKDQRFDTGDKASGRSEGRLAPELMFVEFLIGMQHTKIWAKCHALLCRALARLETRPFLPLYPLGPATPIRCSRDIFDLAVAVDNTSVPSCELVLLSSIASFLAASRAALRCSYAAMSSAFSDNFVAGLESILMSSNPMNVWELLRSRAS